MKSILKKYSILIIFTPILKSVEVIFELIIPILILKVINTSNIEIITKNIVFIFLLYLIGFITSVISQYLASITAHKIGHELRKITFKKVMDNKNFDYSKQTNIVTNDIKEVVNGINIFSTNLSRMPKECTSLNFNKMSQFATMIYFKSPNYKVGLYIDVFANCAIWSGDRKVWKYITETS